MFGASDGERADQTAETIHRRIVLGTADDPKTIASARKAVVGLTREINLNDVRTKTGSMTFADLSRHFQQREIVRGNTRIACSTRKAYEGYLKKWIEPRSGEYRLLEIRAVEVESWLKSFTKSKKEPWGQTVSRFIGPEGLLVGITFTPLMRGEK